MGGVESSSLFISMLLFYWKSKPNMDALSSSFLTCNLHSPAMSTRSSLFKTSVSPSFLSVSSVRIEEKPPSPETKPPAAPFLSPTSFPSKSATAAKPAAPSKVSSDPSLPALFLNAFDDVINNFVDPPLRRSVDPRFVLASNFAPVDELPPTKCEVIYGSLPPCLDGAYIRNGPNPQFLPRGPYHLFDGDGMLHSLRISQGTAVLCSRFVKTHKYTVERDAGFPVIPNVFSGFNGLIASAARGAVSAGRFFTGQFNPANGIGLANTSLAFFGNHLYALGESDLPYAIRLSPSGDVETIGRHDFDGKLFMSMTAHPKIDPDTGKAYAYRYGPLPPFLTFFHFNSAGEKQPDVPIYSLDRPSLLHDFAITKKYAIFADIQIGMNPIEMVVGGSAVGSDPSKIPRLGVISLSAKDDSEMKWFNVPGFNIMHAINAWDEDDEIVLVAPNIISIEHTLERMELIHAMVERVKINLKTGIVSRQPISTRNLDMAVINPAYMGKKNRFVYAAVGDPMPKMTGVVKLDVSQTERRESTVGCRMFGPGCYGGEPFFVAKEPDNAEAEEDDGYVVSYVHEEMTGKSKFVVMDAKSPELEIVAVVELPRRVPYGFHGLFVRESDLKKL